MDLDLDDDGLYHGFGFNLEAEVADDDALNGLDGGDDDEWTEVAYKRSAKKIKKVEFVASKQGPFVRVCAQVRVSGTIDDQGAKGTSTGVLLDSQSTVDVFNNGHLLKNIRPAGSTLNALNLRCNAGVVQVRHIGDLVGYGEVWYYPGGIADITSLARLTEKGKHRVTFDSDTGTDFLVTNKETGKLHRFRRTPKGLHLLDATTLAEEEYECGAGEEDGDVFITTVDDTKAKYTNALYLRAVAVPSYVASRYASY